MANQRTDKNRPGAAASSKKSIRRIPENKIHDVFSDVLNEKFGNNTGLILQGIVISASVRESTSNNGINFNVLEVSISDGGKNYKFKRWADPAKGETLPELSLFDCVRVYRLSKCHAAFGELECEGEIEIV